jgi:formate dehydrogenase major subunit
MHMSRRQFLRFSSASIAGSSMAVLGLMPATALAEVRQYKLTRTTETRNTCPYCSVGCGLLMYGLGDHAKNAIASIIHIEGDPDHPVNRGTLCPKGASLIDFIHSPNRLVEPQYRAPGGTEWQAISWTDAMDRIARLLKKDRDAHFVHRTADGKTVNRWTSTGMLAASAASNEVGYLTHKVARSMGLLAFDNQARVCHGPTVMALQPSFGRGAMTNHWVDIKNADVILSMGGNAAEAHPCGFKWVVEAKAHNKAKLIVVDPRFTRTAAVSDYYVANRTGTDIVFLGAIINYLLTTDQINHDYVLANTDLQFIVRADFGFEDGLYSGYDAATGKYDRASWDYEIGADGYAKVDPTLQHPRTVYQLMKQHYSRYTPELVERVCGVARAKFQKVAETMASTAKPGRAGTILFALGWTQHSNGAQTIRTACMMQLLLGNIGISGGGMNALRGHSNIQGLTDLGLLSSMLPGYLTLPTENEQDYQAYITKRTLKPLRPNQLSYWSNYPKFHVSFMKTWWGDAAKAENDWAYDYLPKLDKLYDLLQAQELMYNGEMNGYIVQGFNTLGSAPDKNKSSAALSRLKFLVVMDPLAVETAEFWKPHGDFNDVDPGKIMTEVFRLPTTCFAEENGSLVSSSRVLQWHWQGAEPPGHAKSDLEIMAGLHLRMKELYRKEGGAYADPILNLNWPYAQPHSPTPEELAMEYNGKALADLTDPKDPAKVLVKKGEQLAGFAQLRDDGSTASGCWIFTGSWTAAGNQMARRDNSDPSGSGNTLNWAWAWPANRRILYNRASCDVHGKPTDPTRPVIHWNGTAWSGMDTPDFKADEPPENGMGAFIMLAEGVARFFARQEYAEGPFPEHYEPFENPLGYNPLHPKNPRVVSNPAARVFANDRARFGTVKDFPHVATSYRLTEHFGFWTKHARLNAIIQPEQFVEIGEDLGREIGVVHGDRVRVTSKRGHIVAKAVVTKRIKALTIEGKRVHTVGLPTSWGFTGQTRPGYLVNTLAPAVGDANTQTPEYKSFLVNVVKA